MRCAIHFKPCTLEGPTNEYSILVDGGTVHFTKNSSTQGREIVGGHVVLHNRIAGCAVHFIEFPYAVNRHGVGAALTDYVQRGVVGGDKVDCSH